MTPEPTAATLEGGSTAAPEAAGRTASAATSGAGWMVMAAIGLAVFVVFTILLLDRVTIPFDVPTLDAVRPWVGDGTIWRVLSESANYPLIVIGVGMVVFLFFTHRRREAVLVAVALIAITAGSEGVKQLVARPRPEGTDPNIPGVVYSYPSGHVLEVLTIFGIIAIHAFRSHLARAVRVLIVVAVLVDADLVGVARVALAAHWPSDIIASFIGGLGALGVYGLFTHNRAEPGH